MNMPSAGLVAVLPCSEVSITRSFYERLGFRQVSGDEGYAMLECDNGSRLHLRAASDEHLNPTRNPCGVYLFADDVDDLAARFPGQLLGATGKPETKPWGTYEFALSDPDGALVRVGWPVDSARHLNT